MLNFCIKKTFDFTTLNENCGLQLSTYFLLLELYFNYVSRFSTPTVIQEVAAVEIVRDHSLHYKMR